MRLRHSSCGVEDLGLRSGWSESGAVLRNMSLYAVAISGTLTEWPERQVNSTHYRKDFNVPHSWSGRASVQRLLPTFLFCVYYFSVRLSFYFHRHQEVPFILASLHSYLITALDFLCTYSFKSVLIRPICLDFSHLIFFLRAGYLKTMKSCG